jgi:hypothetical protein
LGNYLQNEIMAWNSSIAQKNFFIISGKFFTNTIVVFTPSINIFIALTIH